jgi:hypothetical protein
MKLSKKQNSLINDVSETKEQEIYVLGSTQSGKTFAIALGTILYAKNLTKDYPDEEFDGAIVGWSVATMKKNILDVMLNFFKMQGTPLSKNKDWKWGNNEKWIKLYNITFTFFPFNNVLSFNNIVGRPLIYIWIDESARIYTQKLLQEQFNQFPGRQMSYANNPYLKTIHSFNVEGGENHDYKLDYLDKKLDKKNYTFFPYDNPKINTKEALKKVIELFPRGSLRNQKVFCKWETGQGRVFNEINVIDSLEDYAFREIGIGIDYGSKNATTFVPIALAQNRKTYKWHLIRLEIYYHNSRELGDTPTTEYYSKQLRLFLEYLKLTYQHVPITVIVIDSEATHYHNRLLADNIPHELAKKGAGSVNEGVQHLQSLIYKGYFLILKRPSIKHIHDNMTMEYTGKDNGIVEFESYQYDTVRSQKEGIDCYKKDNDHCLTGDTLIKTDKGNIPIKDLVNTKGKVYCYNGEKFVLRNYDNCKITQRNVDIYELELSNGYKIKGTYDHPVLTTNGYVMLGELKKTDQVICFN